MKKKSQTLQSWCGCCNNSFWGWFFLIFGLYLLARDLGFIPRDFPFWALVSILIGVYILTKRKDN